MIEAMIFIIVSGLAWVVAFAVQGWVDRWRNPDERPPAGGSLGDPRARSASRPAVRFREERRNDVAPVTRTNPLPSNPGDRSPRVQFAPAETVEWNVALGAFPFLHGLPPTSVTVEAALPPAGSLQILTLAPTPAAPLGYTLLARRTASWSARALLIPEPLTSGPQLGPDPDPRRAAQIGTSTIRDALTAAHAWLHVEGPWRVIGIEGQAIAPGEGESLSRLLDLALEIFPQIPEPDEFSGGLEWNV